MSVILLVYPDETNREYLAEVLEEQFYHTIEALCCEEGLSSYRSKPTDLIIVDASEFDEIEISQFQSFRDENPKAKIITVVDESCPFELEVEDISNDAFQKPVSVTGLLNSVRMLLGD